MKFTRQRVKSLHSIDGVNCSLDFLLESISVSFVSLNIILYSKEYLFTLHMIYSSFSLPLITLLPLARKSDTKLFLRVIISKLLASCLSRLHCCD